MTLTTGPEDFWKFFALREHVRRRKEAKEGPPYSDDPILARYHFCNVFRECDTGTKYFQQFRAKRGQGVDGTILWQSLVYRPVNRIETFEAWHYETGSPFVERGHGKTWLRWLQKRMAAGEKVFTGRHLNRGFACYRAMIKHVEAHFESIVDAIDVAGKHGDLELVVDLLRAIPNIGPFFGWQVACDLVESHVVKDDPKWAQLGPGALRGAELVSIGIPTPDCDAITAEPTAAKVALATARWLVRTQDRYVRSDHVVGDSRAAGWCWYRYPVVLKDIEHALCEYARYCDARLGRSSLEVKPWAK